MLLIMMIIKLMRLFLKMEISACLSAYENHMKHVTKTENIFNW